MGTAKPRNTTSLVGGCFQVEQHIADTMGAAHWHDDVELNLLLSGQMTYLINGRREQVEAGRLVLFWAAIPHRSIEVVPGSPLVCAYLPLADFLALAIDRETKQAVMQGRLLTSPLADDSDVALVRRWVRDWDTRNAARRQLVTDEAKLRVRRLSIDRALADPGPLERSPTLGSSRRSQMLHTEALIELINTHYSEPLSVPRLSRLANMHPSTAAAAFRSMMGTSINEYLIRYRLAQALHRLADTDDPILDIAFACGFGSASRFYDLFRQRLGDTPLKYRWKVQGRDPPNHLEAGSESP